MKLRQDEKLIKSVRRHWVFLMLSMAGWLAFLIILLILKFYSKFDLWGYWWQGLSIVAFIILLIVLRKYYLWKNNTLVITDKRVVKNEQYGIFSKTVTELLFSDILEIAYHKMGLNGTMFNYGDVEIRTASENDIIISGIPNPENIVEAINHSRSKNG